MKRRRSFYGQSLKRKTVLLIVSLLLIVGMLPNAAFAEEQIQIESSDTAIDTEAGSGEALEANPADELDSAESNINETTLVNKLSSLDVPNPVGARGSMGIVGSGSPVEGGGGIIIIEPDPTEAGEALRAVHGIRTTGSWNTSEALPEKVTTGSTISFLLQLRNTTADDLYDAILRYDLPEQNDRRGNSWTPELLSLLDYDKTSISVDNSANENMGATYQIKYVYEGGQEESDNLSLNKRVLAILIITKGVFVSGSTISATFNIALSGSSGVNGSEKALLDNLGNKLKSDFLYQYNFDDGAEYPESDVFESNIVTAQPYASAQVSYASGVAASDPNQPAGMPSPSTVETAIGSQYTISSMEPTRNGYTFTGWYCADAHVGGTYRIGSGMSSFIMPANNVVLTAQWRANGGGGDPIIVDTDPEAPENPDATVTPAVYRPTESRTTTGSQAPRATVSPQEAPLAASDPGNWALVNLILTIIGTALAVLLMALYLVRGRKTEQTDENAENADETGYRKKRLAWRIGVAVLAVIAIILFVLTEDMSLQMALVDQWTIPHAIIALAQIVFSAIVFHKTKTGETSPEEQTFTV